MPISHWPALATSWWEHFDRHAHFFGGQHHGVTQVLQLVDRGKHREVAALDGRTMALVAAFVLGVGFPRGFFREDLAVGADISTFH